VQTSTHNIPTFFTSSTAIAVLIGKYTMWVVSQIAFGAPLYSGYGFENRCFG